MLILAVINAVCVWMALWLLMLNIDQFWRVNRMLINLVGLFAVVGD